MATVTTADVQRIAHLARLTLTTQEAEAMTAHVTKILAYMEKLNAVPTDAVEPATHAVTVAVPLRPDQITNTPDPALVQIAPVRNDAFFAVPKVIE
jgi:aspartyl-tRNA(Asn)/glutamyl-tRNA(Gln) amidotransferase subunit C